MTSVKAAVLKALPVAPQGSMRVGGPRGQNYSHENSNTLFAFSIVLAFASMVQEQHWVKLLVPWHQIVLTVIEFCTTTPSPEKKKMPVSLKNILNEAIKIFNFIKS